MMYPHEVEIGSNTDGGQDPNTGEWIEGGYQALDTFECEVAAITGSEFVEAQKIDNSISYNVFMDYDERVKPSHIVKWNGQELNIEFVQPVMPDINGTPEQLILKCSSN